ncbi:MAG: hypothetical protein J7L99_03310 [Planctomycetes bacterium]|nr:hypothetical protein [Planctomycetota bacterium]
MAELSGKSLVYFRVATIVLVMVVSLVVLGVLLGSMGAFFGAMSVIFTDGLIAILLLLAAGGFGGLLLRALGINFFSNFLTLSTVAAVGLGMLSTTMIIVGSLFYVVDNSSLWWAIVIFGVILFALQAFLFWRRGQQRFSRGASGQSINRWFILPAILIAVALGMYLAGAVIPAGMLGNLTMDSYDVLEYHLQLPREFYHIGRITTLRHNIYSHYPLGVEMLYLLSFSLRAGAYKGMYLAKMISLMFSVIAIVGMLGGGSSKGRIHSLSAAVLVATAPWVIYLSRIAMVESAQLCYLALALMWLKRWLDESSWTSSLIIGLLLGLACSVKYLSVGFIAGPVLLVMLVAAMVRHGRGILRVLISAVMCLLVFSPWMIRNLASTGNPVFPLAMNVFGKGYLTEQLKARWQNGHAPGYHQPVPPPADYTPPKQRLSRIDRLFAWAVSKKPYHTNPPAGLVTIVIATLMVLLMMIRPTKIAPWYWAVFAVLLMDLFIWMMFTHEMPARFMAVSIIPLSILAAGIVGFAEDNIKGRKKVAVRLIFCMLLLVASGNLLSAWRYHRREMKLLGVGEGGAVVPAGVSAETIADNIPYYESVNELAPGSRVMLIGEARAFYFPENAVYATVFNEHPLETILQRTGSRNLISRLNARGITHVFIAWAEIERLAHSYGWSREIAPTRLRKWFSNCPVIAQKDDLLTLFELGHLPQH